MERKTCRRADSSRAVTLQSVSQYRNVCCVGMYQVSYVEVHVLHSEIMNSAILDLLETKLIKLRKGRRMRCNDCASINGTVRNMQSLLTRYRWRLFTIVEGYGFEYSDFLIFSTSKLALFRRRCCFEYTHLKYQLLCLRSVAWSNPF